MDNAPSPISIIFGSEKLEIVELDFMVFYYGSFVNVTNSDVFVKNIC